MSINFTSVTVTNGSANVTINTSIDLTAIQYGWELQVIGAPLMLSIASGGQNEITLQQPYTATGTLTNVAAKIIETKAALAAALDNVTLFGNQMIATKNTNQDIIDALGSAANADVTISNKDTTAGRLTKVGYAGIGGTAAGFSDWNAIPQYFNGMIGLPQNAANKPAELAIGFYHVVKFGDGNESFIAKKVNSSEVYILSRSNSGTDWIFHGLLFHSGNSVNPLDYGLGVSGTGINVTDIDNISLANGLYRISAGTLGVKPSGVVTNSTLLVQRISSTLITQTLIAVDQGIDFRKFGRTYNSGWSEWVEIYHSGNTNFHIFGGNGAGDRFASGTAVDATTVFFELHLSSLTPATGFNVQGTFRIVAHNGTSTLVSGLTSADFSSSNSRPSSRLITILVTVPSGLTSKDPVYLETESSDARIRVDF
jgi:hypothetical protein